MPYLLPCRFNSQVSLIFFRDNGGNRDQNRIKTGGACNKKYDVPGRRTPQFLDVSDESACTVKNALCGVNARNLHKRHARRYRNFRSFGFRNGFEACANK